jgi:Sec-independent protein translocase protein TatA
MFDTSFLQVVVCVLAGALLVGPKDLPVVARKLGGLLGKGVGFVGRTRTSVQSFINEHELNHVQQDFERSLQQIRQVQDEVKQGLTSPISQMNHQHFYTNHAYINEVAHFHKSHSHSSSVHLPNNVDCRSIIGESPYTRAMYFFVLFFCHFANLLYLDLLYFLPEITLKPEIALKPSILLHPKRRSQQL